MYNEAYKVKNKNLNCQHTTQLKFIIYTDNIGNEPSAYTFAHNEAKKNILIFRRNPFLGLYPQPIIIKVIKYTYC